MDREKKEVENEKSALLVLKPKEVMMEKDG